MTEQEFREKIVKILEEAYEPIEYGDDDIHGAQIYFPSNEDVANALIWAGIGDVSEYERLKTELRSKVDYIHELWDVKEDYKHRLRLTERALYRACGSSQMMLVFLQKAEKELAEERKNYD